MQAYKFIRFDEWEKHDYEDLWPRDVGSLLTYVACGSTDRLEGVTQPHVTTNHGLLGATTGNPLLQSRSL
ncbi:unnamed protein product [Nezara viridula]|uniref:Uncharacterized protein n=1 Tax=Nezara viridula TaxID=85310 RepID=A0A9P0H3H9_NEZVI|nr:unnamed protein product [Nezara viridula]